MNVQKVFNAGGNLVRNPNYTPYNGQPEYIMSTAKQEENLLAKAAREAAGRGDLNILGSEKDLQKYTDYGITPSTVDNNLDKQLADAQSNWEKAWHSLGQTVISEVLLGTAKGISDLIDFTVGGIIRTATGEENDYTNPVSSAIKSAQDYLTDEAMPIYVDPSVNIQNGGFTDFGWYMKNFPSIASALTLLIPSTGITKGLGYLGKLANVGGKVSKARRWATRVKDIEEAAKLNRVQLAINNPVNIARANAFVENSANALLMRTMENYQEANDVHTQTYENASDALNKMDDKQYKDWVAKNKAILGDKIDTSDRDAVAKHIAKEAANRTFAMDYSNLIFDVIQLYGLKNIGKGIKQLSAKGGGRAVQEAIRESTRAAGEYAGKEVGEQATTGMFKKGLQYTSDFIRGDGKIILEESTEGIEEAVNYIAQQEGLTYGTALIDGTATKWNDSETPAWLKWATLGTANGALNVINTWRHLQNPLTDYLSSPELQESAFWGVAGGWVFGAGGSAFNRMSLALERKAQNEARKENPITGEKVDTNGERGDSFIDLLELPEQKAARIAIADRQRKLEVLASQLKDVKDGIDVFAEEDETTHKKPSFTGDVQSKQAIARARLISDYEADITVAAMNSGTYNSLVEYMKDENVKAAMVKAGVVSESEVDAYTQGVVERMERIKDIYARQSTHVLNQISALNASRNNKFEISLDYAQQIAKRNLDKILEVEAIDREIAAAEANAAAEEENAMTGMTDEQIAEKRLELQQAKEGVRLGLLIDLYGRFEADKRHIKESTDDTYEKEAQLRSIEEQQNNILRELSNTTVTVPGIEGSTSVRAGISAVYSAMKRGSRYAKQDEKYVEKVDFEKADADVIKSTRQFLGRNAENISDETILQQAKVLEQQLEKAVGEQGLYNLNKSLFEQYGAIAQLRSQRNIYQSSIASTQSAISNEVDKYHNRLNKARGKIIEDAMSIILNTYNKYKGVADDSGTSINNAILEAYRGNKQRAKELADEYLDDEDSKKFIGALEALNLANRSNQEVMDYIQAVLNRQRLVDARQSVSSDEETGENSSASENSISDTENSQIDNSSSNTSKSDTTQDRGQNEAQTLSETSSQTQNRKPTRYIKLIINNSGSVVAIKNGKAGGTNTFGAFDNGDGTLTIDVKSLPRNQQLKLLKSGLFDSKDINLLDETTKWNIESNPTIRKKSNGYEVVSRGEVSEELNTDNILNHLTEDEYNIVEEILNQENDITVEQIQDRYNVSKIKANRIAKAVELLSDERVDSTPPVEEMNDNAQPVEQSTEQTTTETPTQTTTTPPAANNNEANANAVSSSTGGSQQTTATQAAPVIPATQETKPTPRDEETIDVITRAVAMNFGKYIPNITEDNLDLDSIAETVRKESVAQGVSSGYSEAEINAAVDKQLALIKDARKKILEMKSQMDKAGANLSFAARYEEVDNTNFSYMFTSAVETFIDEYSKIVPVAKVDGKQIVKLEDVLRICNNAYGTADASVARAMYDVIVNYLQSPIGRAKYEVIDIQKGRSVIDNINKSSEELQQEYDNENTTERVNIGSYIEAANASDPAIRDRYFKAFDSIQVGDKLQLRFNSFGHTNEIVFLKNGVVIGNMPLPYLDGDKFVIVNDGWVTDVKLDANNNPISRSRDAIADLFLGTTKAHDDLRELLTKYMIVDDSKNAALLTQFQANPLIATLIQDSIARRSTTKDNLLFVDDKTGVVDVDRVFRYLARLWQYSTLSTNASDKATNMKIIKRNLDRWFVNRYNTYNNVWNQFNFGNEGDVEVTGISQGAIIRVIDSDSGVNTVDGYDQLPLAMDGLADVENSRLTIVDPRDSTSALISGKPIHSVSGFSNASTLISIFSKNKQPDYVKAIGVKLNDPTLLNKNDEINNICKAVASTIADQLKVLADNPTYDNVQKLKQLLTYTFDCSSNPNIIPLFRTFALRSKIYVEDIVINGKQAGINIAYSPDGNTRNIVHRIKVFYTGNYGNALSIRNEKNGSGRNKYARPTDTDFAKQEVIREGFNAITEFMTQYCNVNISKTGIVTDNVKNPNLEGFLTRNADGKLVVDIPSNSANNYHKEFDSYNDFIVKNNLIRVNTKKGENGTNFTRKGKNQRANQNLYVSLPSITRTNPTSTTTNEHIESSSSEATFNNVKQIVNTNKDNAGVSILEEVLGKEELDKFTSIAEGFGILNDILPTRIMYDPNLNEYKNDKVRGVLAYSSGSGQYVTYKHIVNGRMVTARIPANERIVIGPLLLNMLSSTSSLARRKQGIRKLIHEQLHIKLQEDETKRIEILREVNSIYDEFKQHLDNDLVTLDKNDPRYKILQNIRDTLKSYQGARLIEEFLVESLTNKNFFDYLNSIETTAKDNGKPDTLFTKIAKAIAKFFGWNIKEDSLYMKELNVLRNIVSPEISEESVTTAEEEVNNNTSPTNEETTEEQNQESDEDDFDVDDFDLDEDDDGSFASKIEEVTEDKDGYRKTQNIDAFKSKLPQDLQSKFDTLVNNGWIEIKCS